MPLKLWDIYIGGGVSAAPNDPSGLLVCQNFEGAGYDNSESWTEIVGTGGVVNEDYTATVLRGSQSLLISESDYHTSNATVSFTASGTIYTHFMFRIDAFPYDLTDIVTILDASNNILCRILMSDAGALTLYHGTDSAGTTATSINTTYHIWLDYAKGTGSNGVATMYVGTTVTKPAASQEVTAGSATADAVKLRLQILQGSPTATIWDQVYVKTTDIGNVPE